MNLNINDYLLAILSNCRFNVLLGGINADSLEAKGPEDVKYIRAGTTSLHAGTCNRVFYSN